MQAILLVDENGHRHTFKTVQSTAQHIRRHQNGRFTVYTAPDVFAKIKALTVDVEDAEDHEAIQGYRAGCAYSRIMWTRCKSPKTRFCNCSID